MFANMHTYKDKGLDFISSKTYSLFFLNLQVEGKLTHLFRKISILAQTFKTKTA